MAKPHLARADLAQERVMNPNLAMTPSLERASSWSKLVDISCLTSAPTDVLPSTSLKASPFPFCIFPAELAGFESLLKKGHSAETQQIPGMPSGLEQPR